MNSLLIIEDDVITAQLYQTLLEGADYNAIIANSTGEATEVLGGIEIDVIILDYNLPGGNSLLWLRNLRQFKKFVQLPVILISETPDHEDLRDDPCVWFLEKPRQPQHIVTAVESTIAQFT